MYRKLSVKISPARKVLVLNYLRLGKYRWESIATEFLPLREGGKTVSPESVFIPLKLSNQFSPSRKVLQLNFHLPGKLRLNVRLCGKCFG